MTTPSPASSPKRKYPVVIPADGRYVCDFGPKAIPQFHEVIKENGAATCSTCAKLKRKHQCDAVVAVRRYIKAGGQHCQPASKVYDETLEVKAQRIREKHTDWVAGKLDKRNPMAEYWRLVYHGTPQELADYHKREGVPVEVIG